MTTVISVRFRSGCKTYFFDPGDVQVQTGDHVIVETAQGLEYAQCTMGNHPVDDCCVIQPLRPMVRVATENDRRTAAHNRAREKEAFDICQKKILQHKLEMKLVRVECSFEGNKILFFFTADGRVDFRELVKDLASVFRARIELRQIGVRDEAKMLGGLGICGRPFCCAQFLDDFVPVSIKMAKTQSLSLNPTKISGTCGRLMCCLKYEQDAYEDALKRMPKNDSFVQTPDGPGNVCEVNVLRETMKVRLDEKPDSPRCYHNCEVCVLRNGKGSRDGIQVPQERPERYVEERPEEEVPMPLVIADFDPDAPAREERPARRRNERRRRGAEASPSRRRRRSRRSGRSPVRRKRSVPMGPGPTTSPAVPAASPGTSPRRTVPSRRRAAPPSRLRSPRRTQRPRRAPSPAAVPATGADAAEAAEAARLRQRDKLWESLTASLSPAIMTTPSSTRRIPFGERAASPRYRRKTGQPWSISWPRAAPSACPPAGPCPPSPP